MASRYTLCTRDRRGDLTVTANGLTAAAAITMIAEDSGSWKVQLCREDYQNFRCFMFRRSHSRTYGYDPFIISATVPKTADLEADEAAAMAMIQPQVISNHRVYGRSQVFTDDQFAKVSARIAERDRASRLDRLITTQLVETLVAHGYAITGNLLEDVPEFTRSTNVKIADHLLEFESAEIFAEKDGQRAWLRLIFGEAGWDVVQDYSESLEKIVDAITEPHLPWNVSAGPHADRRYEVFALAPPEGA